MKNILLNFHLFSFKYIAKTGRNFVCTNSVRCFSDSLSRCQALSECQSKAKKSLSSLRNIRCVSTSVTKFEKLTEISKSKERHKDLSIIYSGSLTYRVKGVKVFTCVSSLGGILIQPLMVQNILSGKDMPLGVALFSCVGFFTFVTPFICHIITKKYVTEIWYNSATDTYTATMLSFFLRKINIDFKIEDVTVPAIPAMFSTMTIKGQPVFIVDESFLEMEHYIKMIGYNKPLDFKPSSNGDEALDKSQSKEKTEVM